MENQTSQLQRELEVQTTAVGTFPDAVSSGQNRTSPVGTVSDEQIFRDLEGVTQRNGAKPDGEKQQSGCSCGCGTSCSGSNCGCSSTGQQPGSSHEQPGSSHGTPGSPSGGIPSDHDHRPTTVAFQLTVDVNALTTAKQLDPKAVVAETSYRDNLGQRGDVLNGRGGTNVVIGSGDSDVIVGRGRGFNTITTGTGKDTVILGQGTTNRIFDFDPANDRLALAGIDPRNVVVAQGTNPGRGGLDQPLDSTNNTIIVDRRSGRILASLPFVKASDLSEKNFVRHTVSAQASLQGLDREGFKSQVGTGKLTGTQGRDRLIGGNGNDFLFVGDDGFKFETARGGGGTEFPFATDSPGTSEVNLEMKNGVLKVNGGYKDFDAAPLFSQGEREIDPNARILNGSNPQALINGFLAVERDSEGNGRTGTHLHFSPAGDSRGNFADATVVRFIENTPTDAKSGTIDGEFELSPVEQAALLAGNLYVNIHSNIDVDGDGRAGFPTGENRLNLNRDVVKFT